MPQACDAGARIASQLRAERVLVERGRARGVLVRTREGRRIELRSAKVVVACGAIETPPFLRRSGLGGHPRLGRGLSIHPALGAAGSFAEPVVAWHGVLAERRHRGASRAPGILLEATSTPPGMGSMALPGVGTELLDRLARATHSATLGAMIADGPGGRVLGARRALIQYRVSRRDRRRLIEALAAIGEVMFAAGAEQVELGGGAAPVRDPAKLAAAVEQVDFRRLHLAAFHPTGTVAAGARSEVHPSGPRGELRGVDGVWVADGSILPSCPRVNPQVSIMAIAGAVGEAAARA